MDPHPHPHPHPHPPQTPLIIRNRSSSNRELLMLPSPLTRVMQQSRPTHTNQPNLDMDSHKVMLPHTTKDKARVGPLPRIHMDNKDKMGIMPMHNNNNQDTHINHRSKLRPLQENRCIRRLNQGIMVISTDIFWCIAKAHTVPPTRTTQQTDVVSRDLDGEIAKIAVSLTIWPIQRTKQIHRHKLTTPGAVVKTSSPRSHGVRFFFLSFSRLDVVDFRWPLFLFRRCQRSAISSPVSPVINPVIP